MAALGSKRAASVFRVLDSPGDHLQCAAEGEMDSAGSAASPEVFGMYAECNFVT